MSASSVAYISCKVGGKTFKYRFTGVTSIEHNLALNLDTDVSQGSDIVNGARNQPNQVTLSVVETDAEHPAGWAARMLECLAAVKKGRYLCKVVTSMAAYSRMLLSEISAVQDEENQYGWSGTLTFMEYIKPSSKKAGSAARSAYGSVRSLFSAPVLISARVRTVTEEPVDAGAPVQQMFSGGRFTKPTDVQVAEDGDAEYIIPVKKENRAVPLLRQLLSELSPSARASLSLGDAAQPLSGGLSAGTATAAQIVQNNSNVSAPVNIQVHSSGANAEQVGQKLYDTAERYLLRTLKGVTV